MDQLERGQKEAAGIRGLEIMVSGGRLKEQGFLPTETRVRKVIKCCYRRERNHPFSKVSDKKICVSITAQVKESGK